MQFPDPSADPEVSLLPHQGLEPCTPEVVGHRVHLIHGGLHVEAADEILGAQLVQVEGDPGYSRLLRRLAGGDVVSALDRNGGRQVSSFPL